MNNLWYLSVRMITLLSILFFSYLATGLLIYTPESPDEYAVEYIVIFVGLFMSYMLFHSIVISDYSINFTKKVQLLNIDKFILRLVSVASLITLGILSKDLWRFVQTSFDELKIFVVILTFIYVGFIYFYLHLFIAPKYKHVKYSDGADKNLSRVVSYARAFIVSLILFFTLSQLFL